MEERAKSDLRKLDEDENEVCWGVLIANCSKFAVFPFFQPICCSD